MRSSLKPRRVPIERFRLQTVETETLIYDERSHKAWCLNQSSACIWRLCDGAHTIPHIALKASAELDAPVTEEIVLLALKELRAKQLLDEDSISMLPPGLTRRQLMSRIGLSAAAILPAIAALTVPRADAQGGPGGSVGTGNSVRRKRPRS